MNTNTEIKTLESAREAAYPTPDTPHTSVLMLVANSHVAFTKGWQARDAEIAELRAALEKQDDSAPVDKDPNRFCEHCGMPKVLHNRECVKIADTLPTYTFGDWFVYYRKSDIDALAQRTDAAPFVPAGYANETEFLRQRLNDANAAMKAAQVVIAERDAILAKRAVSDAETQCKAELWDFFNARLLSRSGIVLNDKKDCQAAVDQWAEAHETHCTYKEKLRHAEAIALRGVTIHSATIPTPAPSAAAGEQPFPLAWSHEQRIREAEQFLKAYSDTNMEKLLGEYQVKPIIRKLAAMIGQWQHAAAYSMSADNCAAQPTPAQGDAVPVLEDGWKSIVSDWECGFIGADKCIREIEKLLDATPPAAPVALSDAINGLMDFAPCKRAQPEGMTRGGPYVRKADVLAILAAATQHTDADKRDASLFEQAAQVCDQQADGTNGPYRSACLQCADAVRELRDAAIAASAKEAK